jgi:hypothetical protein
MGSLIGNIEGNRWLSRLGFELISSSPLRNCRGVGTTRNRLSDALRRCVMETDSRALERGGAETGNLFNRVRAR